MMPIQGNLVLQKGWHCEHMAAGYHYYLDAGLSRCIYMSNKKRTMLLFLCKPKHFENWQKILCQGDIESN